MLCADGSGCELLVGFANSMTTHATVRSYRSEDRQALEALWTAVFPDDPPWNEPSVLLDAKLLIQPELVLVAVLEGRLVGAIMAGFDGVRGWLYHLAVAEDCRRQGIATSLVRVAEEGLKRIGCMKANLQVRVSNAAVIEFYRSLGYGIEERVSMGRRFTADA